MRAPSLFWNLRDGRTLPRPCAFASLAVIISLVLLLPASGEEPLPPKPGMSEYLVSAGAIRDGWGGFDALSAPTSVVAVEISERTYLLVAARADNAIQVVDVTDPALPVQVASMQDGQDGFDALAEPQDVEIVRISGGTYALVAAYADNAVQIVDVTSPAAPEPVVVIVDGQDGFDALAEPIEIEVVRISGRIYMLVASTLDDAIQIVEITDPAAPVPVAVLRDGQDGFDALRAPADIEIVRISGLTYLLVAAYAENAVQVADITDPATPVPVASIRDERDGFDALNGPTDMTVVGISGRTYAMVAARWSNSVQVMDITNPASPEPVAILRDEQGGFGALNGPGDMDVARISGHTYLLVAASLDNAIQVVDVTDPALPVPVAGARDGRDRFDHLEGPIDVEVARISGHIYLMVAASLDDAVQITDITGLTSIRTVSGQLGEDGGIPVYFEQADAFYYTVLGGWVADNVYRVVGSYPSTGNLTWPHTSSVVFKMCESANAYYDPDTGDIIICYELIKAYADVFDGEVLDGERAVLDTLGWVFFHEVGHMIMDVYKLPVVGQEESAADQFATMAMLERGESGADALLYVAHSFFRPPFMQAEEPYWDTHLLDQQRYYNILCMVYGSDPDSHGDLVDEGFLPEERAVHCRDEYERAERAWDTILGRG